MLGTFAWAASLTARVFLPNDGKCKNKIKSGTLVIPVNIKGFVNVPPRHLRVTKYSPHSLAVYWVNSSNCGCVETKRIIPAL